MCSGRVSISCSACGTRHDDRYVVQGMKRTYSTLSGPTDVISHGGH